MVARTTRRGDTVDGHEFPNLNVCMREVDRVHDLNGILQCFH